MRGVVYGILGTAVAQGILTTFGLWLAGMPRPLLLGVIAGGWRAADRRAGGVDSELLWLMADGHLWRGLFLFAYGLIAVSGADLVMRPYFIARGAQLPFLLTLLGVSGAREVRLLGVFVGPVLLGVGFTLVRDRSHPYDADPDHTAEASSASARANSVAAEDAAAAAAGGRGSTPCSAPAGRRGAGEDDLVAARGAASGAHQ